MLGSLKSNVFHSVVCVSTFSALNQTGQRASRNHGIIGLEGIQSHLIQGKSSNLSVPPDRHSSGCLEIFSRDAQNLSQVFLLFMALLLQNVSDDVT